MYRAKLIYAKISFVQVLTNISERSHPMKCIALIHFNNFFLVDRCIPYKMDRKQAHDVIFQSFLFE